MLETKNKKRNFLLLSLPVSSLYFPCLSILGGPSTKYLTTVTDSTEIISTLSNSQLQHRTEWFFVIHYISLNNERSTHLWLQVSVDKIILPQHLQPWSCTEQTTQFLPRIPTFSLKEEGGGGKKSETQWIRLIPSCLIKCLATASDTLPWRWIYVARSPPVQYSRIKYILSSVYSPNKKTLLYYQKNQNLNFFKKKKIQICPPELLDGAWRCWDERLDEGSWSPSRGYLRPCCSISSYRSLSRRPRRRSGGRGPATRRRKSRTPPSAGPRCSPPPHGSPSPPSPSKFESKQKFDFGIGKGIGREFYEPRPS